MKKLGGWQRIWVMLSVLWIAFILIFGAVMLSADLLRCSSNRAELYEHLVYEIYQFEVKAKSSRRRSILLKLTPELKNSVVDPVEVEISERRIATYPKGTPQAEIDKVIKYFSVERKGKHVEEFLDSLRRDFPNIDFSEIDNDYQKCKDKIYTETPSFVAAIGILPPLLLYLIVSIIRRVVVWVIKGFKRTD